MKVTDLRLFCCNTPPQLQFAVDHMQTSQKFADISVLCTILLHWVAMLFVYIIKQQLPFILTI